MEDSAGVNQTSLDDNVTNVPLGRMDLDLLAAEPATVIWRDPHITSVISTMGSALAGLAHMAPNVIAANRGTGAFQTAESAYATVTRRSAIRGRELV